jgi:hypothetical protein
VEEGEAFPLYGYQGDRRPESAEELAAEPCVRLAGYWHDSLIEGPGRRSVAKVQGCPRARAIDYR